MRKHWWQIFRLHIWDEWKFVGEGGWDDLYDVYEQKCTICGKTKRKFV